MTMHLLLQEESCPVSDEMLGAIYRANSFRLDGLVASVPAEVRAMLALYCYRRGHLQSIGLAIAATCEEHDLRSVGGRAGVALFDMARQAPIPERVAPHLVSRKKVSLSKGLLREVVEDEDIEASTLTTLDETTLFMQEDALAT
jgi:hypothetical protein